MIVTQWSLLVLVTGAYAGNVFFLSSYLSKIKENFIKMRWAWFFGGEKVRVLL